MSAIRCEECPYIGGPEVGTWCAHPDAEGGAARLVCVLTPKSSKAIRPLWCPRRRDASSRCRTCGELLIACIEVETLGDIAALTIQRSRVVCPRCNP